jgi:L-fuconolactonase
MSATPRINLYYNICVNTAWLDRRKEAIIAPELPIVDPHHHLWVRADSRYMLDDLLADLSSGHKVIATVYMQCDSMYRANGAEELRPLGETEFVNSMAAITESEHYEGARVCAGMVGYADLTLGARVREILEKHIDIGEKRFCGIRNISAWDADSSVINPDILAPRGLLNESRFREGFACLAPLNLSFDAWLYHPQIKELTALAQAFPNTRIVMNHVGGPIRIGVYAGRYEEVFTQWHASIQELAKCPNVFVKLGGLGMALGGFGFHEKADPPSSQELAEVWRPYVETCIEVFGANRCMFESNFPVDKGSYSYAVGWNAFKRLVSGYSADEKADLLSHTASRCYNLAV